MYILGIMIRDTIFRVCIYVQTLAALATRAPARPDKVSSARTGLFWGESRSSERPALFTLYIYSHSSEHKPSARERYWSASCPELAQNKPYTATSFCQAASFRFFFCFFFVGFRLGAYSALLPPCGRNSHYIS